MRKLMIAAAVLGIAALGFAPFPAAAAGKYDGSNAMICGATSVTECEAGRVCQRRSPESVNLPALFRIDTKAMKVHNLEAEKGRSSAIRTVEHANGKLVLSGADGERGWVVLVHEDSGRMSAVVSGDGEGFVVFGQCVLP